MSSKQCTTCGPGKKGPTPVASSDKHRREDKKTPPSSTLKQCTTCGPTRPKKVKPDCPDKKKKFISCESDLPEEENYCCGDGYMVIPGPCNTFIRSRWVSEADPLKVETTVTKLLKGLSDLYSGPVIDPTNPASLSRILALGVFCEHSTVQGGTVTSASPVSTSGVGTSTDTFGAVYQLAVLLNSLKALNGYLEFDVQKRLQENDLLYLTISLLVYNSPPSTVGRVLVSRYNLYGQWYVSQCGSGLCIDWLNISSAVLPTAPVVPV